MPNFITPQQNNTPLDPPTSGPKFLQTLNAQTTPDPLTYRGVDVESYGDLIKNQDNLIFSNPQDLDGIAAENQSGFTQVAKALPRIAGSAILKTAQGMGLLSSVLGVAAGNAAKGIYNAGEGEDVEYSGLEDITNNWLVNPLFKWEESMKEALKIYKPDDWNERNILQQLGSTAWWADEGADGLAFALSTILPSGALGRLGLGAKVASRLGGGIMATEEGAQLTGLYGTAARAGQKLNTMGKLGEYANSLLLQRSGLSSPIRMAQNLDNLTQVGIMTGSESLFEARDMGEQFEAKYLNDLGLDNVEQLTPEQREYLRENKANAMANTFWANMAALAVSNKIEVGLVNKLFGNTVERTARGLIDPGKTIFDSASLIERKGISRFLNSRVGVVGSSALKQAAVEGLYEENIQNAIQNVSLNFGNTGIVDYAKEVLDETFNNLSDGEAWKSIAAGAIIGGLFGAVGGNSVYNANTRNATAAINGINSAKNNYINLKNNLYEREDDGSIKVDATGMPVYNNDAITQFKANQNAAVDLTILHDLYKEAGNPEVADVLKNEAITKMALAHLEAGLGDELSAKIKALSNYSEQDLAEYGLDPIEIVNGRKISIADRAARIENQVEGIKRDYETITSIIPNVDENSSRIGEAVRAASRVRNLSTIEQDLTQQLFNTPSTELEKLEAKLEALERAKEEDYNSRINVSPFLKRVSNIYNTITGQNLDTQVTPEEARKQSDREYNGLIEQAREDIKNYKELNPSVQSSDFSTEKIRTIQIANKLEQAIIAKRREQERFNKIMSDPNYILAENIGKVQEIEETKAREAEVVSELDNFNEGDLVDFNDNNGNTKTAYVSRNNRGELTLDGNILNSAYLSKHPEIKIYSPEERESWIQEGERQIRIQQTENRIIAAQNNLSFLEQELDGYVENLIKAEDTLQDLQYQKATGKTRLSPRSLNKRIKDTETLISGIEADISRNEELIANRKERIRELEDRIAYSNSGIGGVLDVSELRDEISNLEDKYIRNEVEIVQSKKVLDKLRDYLTFLKQLWVRAFPDKKRVLSEQPVTNEDWNRVEEYSNALTEIDNTKEDIAQREEALEALENYSKQLSDRIEFARNELKEFELQAARLRYTANVRPENKTTSVETVDSNQKFNSSDSYGNGPKPDISNGLFKTAGSENSTKPSQQRWFRFTETLDPKSKYKLRTVKIDDAEYGVAATNDLFAEDEAQYVNTNNIKVLVVDRNNQPVLRDGQFIYTSLIEIRDDQKSLSDFKYQNGDNMFTNKNKLKGDEIKAIIEDYRATINSIKNSPTPLYLDIVGKSNGELQEGEPISAEKAFGANLPIRVITDANTTFNGEDYRTPVGMVYTNYNGRPIAGDIRNITPTEAVDILKLLKDYSKVRGDIKGKGLMEKLSSIVFMGKSNNPTFSTFFVQGKDELVFGNNTISIKQLQDGVYDQQIIDHLTNLKHQVDRKMLNNRSQYTDISGTTWPNYENYLLSQGDRTEAEIPVKFSIPSIGERQIKNIYLNYSAPKSAQAKEKQKQTKAKQVDKQADTEALPYTSLSKLLNQNKNDKKGISIDDLGGMPTSSPSIEDLLGESLTDIVSSAQETQTEATEATDGFRDASRTTSLKDIEDKNVGDIISKDDILANTEEKKTSSPVKEEGLGSLKDDPLFGDLFDSEAPFLDKSRVSNYTKADLEKEEAEIKRLLGENVPVKKISGLIRNRAFGQLQQDGTILLSDLATEGTGYHEAFHRVSLGYLTAEERQTIYNEYRSRNNVDLTDSQAEEALAEEFREFMLTNQAPSNILQKIFQRIKNFLRRLVGISPETQEQLFNTIAQRGYANRDLRNGKVDYDAYSTAKVFSKSVEKDIFDGMTFLLMQALHKNGFSTSDINKFNKGLLEGEDEARFRTIYPQIFESLERALIIGNKNNSESINELITFIRANRNQIAKDFNKYLKKYNITLNDEVENEELSEEEKSKDTLGVIDSIEFNTRTGMPNAIKMMIAGLPAMQNTEQGTRPILNNLNLPTVSNYKRNIAVLHNELAGISSFEGQMKKVKELSARIPEFRFLFKHLGVTGEVMTPETLTQEQVTLQTQFRQQFDKAYYTFYTQIYEGENSFLVDSNSDRLSELVRTQWRNNFKTQEGPQFKQVDGVKVFDANYFNQKYTGKRTRETILSFYKDLGITFSNPDNVDIDVLADKMPVLIKAINDNDIDDLFGDLANSKGWMNSIVEQEVRNNFDTTDNQHINPEGKTVYNVSLNNYLSILASKLNTSIPEYLNWNESEKKGNPLVRNSKWLQKIKNGEELKVTILEGSRLNEQGEQGESTSNLTRGDSIVQQFVAGFNGVFPFLRAGDKKLEYGFTFGNKPNIRSLNDITNTFRGYLADELLSAWMLNVEGVGNNIAQYKNVGKDLRIFKGQFPKRLETSYKAIISRKQSREAAIGEIDRFVNRENVTAVIQQYLQQKVDNAVEEFINSEVVEQQGNEYNLVGLPNEVIERYSLPRKVSKSQLTSLVEQFIWNYQEAAVEQTKLFTGDLAFYKEKATEIAGGLVEKTNDFHKRTSGLVGTGKTMRNDAQFNQWLNSNMPQEYYVQGEGFRIAKESDGKINSWVFKDVKSSSNMINNYIRGLKEQAGFTEKEAQKLLSTYKGYDEADAQGYITIPEYRELLYRAGDWTDSHEAIYSKIIQGEPLTKEELFSYPPLKPQYFGPQQYDSLYVPTFYKLSLMPLIPSVIKGTQLEQLNNRMLQEGVGITTFESANKVGTLDTIPFYNSQGEINTDDNNTQVLDYDYMKIQLDISPEAHTSVTFGTQFRKLVLSNIVGRDLTVNGKKINGRELADKYTKLINRSVELETQRLIKKMGIEREGNDFKFTNLSYLRDLLEDEALSRNVPDNVIEGINEVITAKRPLEVLVTRAKMENILMSLVNNNIIRQKVFGDMKVQGASTGFEVNTRQQSQVSNEGWAAGLETLKFYEYTENGTTAMEVYLPSYFGSIYGGQNIKVSDIKDKRLLNLIGFRIPTQGLNSIETITVKGFLPPEAGNLVIVPSEIVAKAGSDFDIDKLNIFFPNFKISRNWSKLKNDFLQRYPELKKKKGMDTLETIIEIAENEPEHYTSILNERELEIYENYLRFVDESQDNYITGYSYIEPNNNNLKAIQNEIISLAWDIVSAPENFPAMISPISADIVKDIANELSSIKRNPYRTKGREFYLDWDYNIETRESYLTGKGGVGITALQNVHHVMGQVAGLMINANHAEASPIYLDHNNTDGNIDLSRTKDIENQESSTAPSIIDTISAFLNGFVDIAKDPFLKTINASTDTANTYFYLIRAGVPLRQAVMFMNQPIITDYLDAVRKNNTIFKKASESGMSRADIEEAVRNRYSSKGMKLFDVQETNDLSSYKANLTANKLRDFIAGKTGDLNNYNAVQQQILTDYLRYADDAQKLSQLIQATNPDTRGMGSTMTTAEESLERFTQIMKDGFFLNVNKFITDTFVGSFMRAVSNGLKIYKPLFFTERDTIKPIFDAIKSVVKQNEYISIDNLEKVLTLAKNDLVSYIVQNSKILNSDAKMGSLQKDLFSGARSLPREIAYYKQTNAKIADNLLVRELYPILSSNVEQTRNSKEIDNLRFFSKKVPTEDANLITEAWRELFDTNPSFGRRLMLFAIMQSGLNNSPISFLQYVPNQYYVPVVSRMMEQFYDNGNREDFLRKFIRNNYQNHDLVPKAALGTYGMTGWISFIKDGQLTVATRNANYPFVKTWDKKKEKYRLWENTNTVNSKGHAIFEEVSKLGDGYRFKEYLSDESMMISNRIEKNDLSPRKEDVGMGTEYNDFLNKINNSDFNDNYKEQLRKELEQARTKKDLAKLLEKLC